MKQVLTTYINHFRWPRWWRMWSLLWEETGVPGENPRVRTGDHCTLSHTAPTGDRTRAAFVRSGCITHVGSYIFYQLQRPVDEWQTVRIRVTRRLIRIQTVCQSTNKVLICVSGFNPSLAISVYWRFWKQWRPWSDSPLRGCLIRVCTVFIQNLTNTPLHSFLGIFLSISLNSVIVLMINIHNGRSFIYEYSASQGLRGEHFT